MTSEDRHTASRLMFDAHLSTTDVSTAYWEIRKEDVRRAVVDYIIGNFVTEEDVELQFDTPLVAGGIINLSDIVDLKEFLEETYEIRIPDVEATPEAFCCADSIAELVARHVQK